MIGFATLFLGLMLGPHDVELIADDRVASVEILLDGVPVALLDERPYRTSVDFGDRLVPHHLEAIGWDRSRKEVARTEQWINLPRPPAEVSVVLESEADDRATRAKVAWSSLGVEEPEAVRVSLDGRPLDVDDPASFPLPPYDPNQLHLLRVEVDFGNAVSASTDVTFGGFYADEVSSEITAVPVQVGPTIRLPSAGERSASIRLDGTPAMVAGVEKGPAEVTFVRDVNAKDSLLQMARAAGRPVPISLNEDHRMRVLWATPQLRQIGDAQHALFPRSGDLDASDGEVYWYLSRLLWPENAVNQKLADAVAVAGMTASARNRRRAVVVVLGPPRGDAASLEPEQVREYLDTLRVPLRVWSTHPDQWARTDHAWGEVEDVSTLWKLARATRRLRRALRDQRIVWLEGKHLPQSIAVDAAARVAGADS